MTNRNNRLVRIVVYAVCGIAFLGAGVWLHQAKSAHLRALNQTLAQKQAAVEEVNGKIGQIGNLETENDTLAQKVAVLEPNLPTDAYIPTFLAQIQSLATATDNHLTSIKPKPKRIAPKTAAPPPAGDTGESSAEGAAATQNTSPNPPAMVSPYDEMDIELGFNGTYLSTLEFFQRLRAFPKMIAINEISLKPSTNLREIGAVSDPVLNVTLQLTAVIAKEK
jgi:Tfp pilus assembly protein PilO